MKLVSRDVSAKDGSGQMALIPEEEEDMLSVQNVERSFARIAFVSQSPQGMEKSLI